MLLYSTFKHRPKSHRYILAVILFGLTSCILPGASAQSSGIYLTSTVPGSTSALITTGIGRIASDRGRSPAQEKLMARRAATVDAYRKLVDSYTVVLPHIANGTKIFQRDGFIKGASVINERTFEDRVEVDISVPLVLKNNSSSVKALSEKVVIYPKPVQITEQKIISRAQWQSLVK